VQRDHERCSIEKELFDLGDVDCILNHKILYI